jgi:hypothetical protein
VHYVVILGKLGTDEHNVKAFDEQALIRMPYDNYFVVHAHRQYERAARRIEETLELIVESESHLAQLPDEPPSFYAVNVLSIPEGGGPYTVMPFSVARSEEVPIRAESFVRVLGAARTSGEAAALAAEGVKKTVSILRSKWKELKLRRQPLMEEFSEEIQLLFL